MRFPRYFYLRSVFARNARMTLRKLIVASRLAQSATGRKLTTGILLLDQRGVNIRRRRSPEVLLCRPGAFGLLTYEFRRQYLRFPSNRKWLSLYRKLLCETGSGFLRPRYSDSGHAECEEVFCFDSVSITFVHIAGFLGDRYK